MVCKPPKLPVKISDQIEPDCNEIVEMFVENFLVILKCIPFSQMFFANVAFKQSRGTSPVFSYLW